MKTSFSTRSGLAFTVLLGVAALSACGGGGGSTSVPAPAATAAVLTPNNGSVAIGSLNLNQPASSTAVNVTSSKPAGPTVDVRDQAAVSLTPRGAFGFSVADSASHDFAGGLGHVTSAVNRSAKNVATNAPYDLSYHGGVVLGSVVSHNIFLNCVQSCRDGLNFAPGVFLADLAEDQFIGVVSQYMQTPGVVDATPNTGRYTKGKGADVPVTYASPRPGATNPYYGQTAIWFTVLNAAGGLGQPDTGLGGGGLGHIYHVFLPANVDTCKESGGVPTNSCYSPDKGSTFTFCAYHGAVTFTSGNQQQTYLYTVEPYQDVSGCRNTVHGQALPNAVGRNGVDPADPGYKTLSHELIEAITDPLLNAWYNNFSGGQEIGDICAEFDNFVTINSRPYVIQSEYSDIGHLCVSGNLTSPANTPQSASSVQRAVH